MLNAANWTVRLNELASRAHVPGAALGIWCDGQEILAAHGVLRSRDDEPWVPLSFGRLGDGTPYIYLSGRVTPRVR